MDTKGLLDLVCRNAVNVIESKELEARLAAWQKDGKPLRIKAGFDPSAPDIHLGHTVLLKKLRQFQDLGHKVVLIIGDTTAMIGDPTGQSKTRPVLTKEQIADNAKTYQEQAFKILKNDPKVIEVVFNSAWLDTPEMLKTFISISGRVTVDQLLVRDDFDKRRKANRPVALQELFYPIMQGYDSVAVKADIEIGGTDQLFNLLMGREIQAMYQMKPQIVMTFPLLVGLDGKNKMSKSLGNHIGVLDSAKDIFGKIMSVPDSLMANYAELVGDFNDSELSSIKNKISADPRNAKRDLGINIAAQYHGQEVAQKQADEFDRVFRDKKESDDVYESIHLSAKKDHGLADILKEIKACSSTSDAWRKIEEGAVTLNGQKVSDTRLKVTLKTGDTLKVGKKKFFKFIID